MRDFKLDLFLNFGGHLDLHGNARRNDTLIRLLRVERKAVFQRNRCRADIKSKQNQSWIERGLGRNLAVALCSEEKLAILQRFESNCLYGGRNRRQIAV
jgi:hypothetical protein